MSDQCSFQEFVGIPVPKLTRKLLATLTFPIPIHPLSHHHSNDQRRHPPPVFISCRRFRHRGPTDVTGKEHHVKDDVKKGSVPIDRLVEDGKVEEGVGQLGKSFANSLGILRA
ncbi:hypothetical protein CEXT_445681 [Caerostris extrusa]|uniref:Uncharacterized protein n=1 Tax=Caerostris extrusa TaxID=172846 RepID=A0AAV4T1P8_CAEEX|nr:hypothetical protein CEXT_445681 [Caerostris extrusa]